MTAQPKSCYTIREHGIPDDAGRPFSLFNDDTILKAHPDYRAAKAGDQAAAVNLVWDIATDYLRKVVTQLPGDVIFVAPFAREATGDNAIPQVLAAAAATLTGGKIDNEIVQVTRVFHTGADPMERLSLRAQFEGDVVAGGCYVLVDDVISMGGTLAELADHIQRAGGLVTAVITLVNAGRIKTLHAEVSVIKKLQERYVNEILNIFGIQPAALTANEAQYLIGFRTADEIRNRLATARKEVNRRLRSKGIRWADERESAGNAQ